MPSPSNASAGDLGSGAGIDQLISALAGNDGMARQRARHALVAKETLATGALVRALGDSNRQVRWESAKALVSIADPDAAPAVVAALEDDEEGVRWLAATTLIATGTASLPSLLLAMIDRPGSVWLREGAHHVFHDLSKQGLGDRATPILAALEHSAPEVQAPVAAAALLKTMGTDT